VGYFSRSAPFLGWVVAILLSGCDGKGSTGVVVDKIPLTPAAPAHLSGEGVSATQITLTWSDRSDNETGFGIERAPESGSAWQALAGVGADTTRFSDNGLQPNTAYRYRVRALNGAKTSAWVESGVIRTLPPPASAPPSPALTARVNGSSSITLTWSINSVPENRQTKFFLDAWKTATPGTLLLEAEEFLGDAATFTHSGLAPDTAYSYRLRAWNEMGYSAEALAGGTTTAAPPDPPHAPTLLSATALSMTDVRLTWQLPDSPSAETFVVSRSPRAAGTWTETTVPRAEATPLSAPAGSSRFEWIDSSGLNADRAYDYRLVAVNAAGTSSPSNLLSVTTMATDPAPELTNDMLTLSNVVYTPRTSAPLAASI
jgi:titin